MTYNFDPALLTLMQKSIALASHVEWLCAQKEKMAA